MSGSPGEGSSAVPTRLAAPPPPPGPGVQPPFVAPPTDGVRRRRGIAISLSVGAVLLVCVLGAAGAAALLVLGSRVVSEQAQASVTAYLTALRDERYDEAYQQLCDRVRATTSIEEFEASERRRSRVTRFEVGGAILSEPQLMVPATVHYVDGSSRSVRYVLLQDARTGEFRVCGEAD